MVGFYVPDDGSRPRGFLLRKGRYTTFAVPALPAHHPLRHQQPRPDRRHHAADQSSEHGFLLAKGADGPVTQIDVPGAPNTSVYGLDDRGRIVGFYDNPNAAPARSASRAAASLLDALPLGLADGKETR